MTEDTNASADPALIIVQSLLCMLREKNVLSRADLEELCVRLKDRAARPTEAPFPCRAEAAVTAAIEMLSICDYVGNKYGGKHRPGYWKD